MATYAYLVDPENQFMTKSGTINVSGFLKVFDAATDDIVVTYKDFNGTENQASIPLDNNGRAIVIADSERAYRLEVYDRYGTLLWTTSPLWCLAAGGGVNVHRTEVISTDGSIDIDKVTVGSTTTFDIGLAPADSDEFLEWVKCADEDVANGIVYPTYVDGTMETAPGHGLHVGKDKFYHITASFRVYPSGTGINYESLTTELKFNDGESTSLLIRRTYDIDNSLHDSVMCEFSYDFKAPADGYLFFQLDNVAVFHDVAVVMQVHRIYSGVNAVPDTCATKQWVQETFDYNLSGKIGYSALEYDGYSHITGISGSAIATTDPSVVSAIASSYAESAVSGISAWSGDFSSISSKLDASASSMFAPSGDYAFNSSVSSKLDASASGDFVLVSSYSSFSSDVTNNISSISSVVSSKADSSALSSYQPVSAMSSYATESYVDSAVSSKLDVTASSLFITALPDDLATTGDVASAVSGKMDKSASGEFYPMTGNPSGFLTAHQSLAGLATVEYVDSSVSSKLDASAYDSAWFQPTSSMSAWIPYSALDYSGTAISGIGGSSLAGMGGGGGADYSGVAPVNVDNDTRLISVDHRTLCVDETMVAYNSGSSAVLGVNVAGLDLSSKMDTSASSLFYSTSNPSGFISGVDLTPYQTTAGMTAYQETSGMTAYQPVGAYIYESALGWAEV